MGRVNGFTSGDFGTLGDVLGEVLGDLDVDLRSPVLEVCGGVPGSDADFSVSFWNVCKKKRVGDILHLSL